MQTNDVFSFLANFSSLPESWLLIGGPAIIGISAAAVLTILRFAKAKKEQAEFKTDLDQFTHEPEIPQAKTSEIILEPEKEPTWAEKLTRGLGRSRDYLSSQISGLFQHGAKLDDALIEKIHETLYRADFGIATTDKFIAEIKTSLRGKENISYDDVKPILRAEIKKIFSGSGRVNAEVSLPNVNAEVSYPKVILIVGVNGVGKTTSIAKMARVFLDDQQKVLLAAADTFRAAAIEQLCEWGERLSVDVIKHKAGADPAAVAFDAIKASKSRGMDVLIIDTAGRLHNKVELMDELGKITKVIGREIPGAPHETLLVIDATTGQNAVLQAKAFHNVAKLTGLVVTKLDGTAKGGVVVNIVDQFKIPVKFIGIGEKINDMRLFNAEEFTESLI